MKAIKDQISAIVVFKATNLANLSEEYGAIRDRLIKGLNKMKVANIYSRTEIEEIRAYMHELLNHRYDATKKDVIGTLRSQFTF